MRNNAFFISNEFAKEKYFPNLRINDLEYYTNGNISESRDKSGKLNYLKGNDKLNSILNCDVVDVSNSSNNRGKLEYFIKKIN